MAFVGIAGKRVQRSCSLFALIIVFLFTVFAAYASAEIVGPRLKSFSVDGGYFCPGCQTVTHAEGYSTMEGDTGANVGTVTVKRHYDYENSRVCPGIIETTGEKSADFIGWTSFLDAGAMNVWAGKSVPYVERACSGSGDPGDNDLVIAYNNTGVCSGIDGVNIGSRINGNNGIGTNGEYGVSLLGIPGDIMSYVYGMEFATDMRVFGSDPVAFTYAYSNASKSPPAGSSDQQGPSGSGLKNTLLKPIHPIAFVEYWDGTQWIRDGTIVAATCGDKQYYKDSDGTGTMVTSNSYSVSENLVCADWDSAASAFSYGETIPNTSDPDVIQGRLVTCNTPENQLAEGYCETGIESSLANIYSANCTANPNARNCVIKEKEKLSPTKQVRVATYEPIQGSPPAFVFPTQEEIKNKEGTLVEDLKDWASPVYLAYRPANCGGGESNFYCTVTHSPETPVASAADIAAINWTAELHNYSPTKKYKYTWYGNDELSRTTSFIPGNTDTATKTYTTTGPKYAVVKVLSEDNKHIALCSDSTIIESSFSGACLASPPKPAMLKNTSGSTTFENGAPVTFTVYVKGGKPFENGYTYQWKEKKTGDLENVDPVNKIKPAVTANYLSPGTKTPQVTVTDSTGGQRTIDCIVEVEAYPVYCSPNKPIVGLNEKVTWTAKPQNTSLTYSFKWKGEGGIEGKTGSPVNTDPPHYTTTGTKTATVTATAAINGKNYSVDAKCNVKVCVGIDCPAPEPSCEITPQNNTIENGGGPNSKIDFTQTYKNYTGTLNPAITCGDAASLKPGSLSCNAATKTCTFTCEKYQNTGTTDLDVKVHSETPGAPPIICEANVKIKCPGCGGGSSPPTCSFTKPPVAPNNKFTTSQDVPFAATATDSEGKAINKGQLDFFNTTSGLPGTSIPAKSKSNWNLNEIQEKFPGTGTQTYRAQLTVTDTKTSLTGTCNADIEIVQPGSISCSLTANPTVVDSGTGQTVIFTAKPIPATAKFKSIDTILCGDNASQTGTPNCNTAGECTFDCKGYLNTDKPPEWEFPVSAKVTPEGSTTQITCDTKIKVRCQGPGCGGGGKSCTIETTDPPLGSVGGTMNFTVRPTGFTPASAPATSVAPGLPNASCTAPPNSANYPFACTFTQNSGSTDITYTVTANFASDNVQCPKFVIVPPPGGGAAARGDFVRISITPDRNPPDYIIGQNSEIKLNVTLTKLTDKRLKSNTVLVRCALAGGSCTKFNFTPNPVQINDSAFLNSTTIGTTKVFQVSQPISNWESGAYTFIVTTGIAAPFWELNETGNAKETVLRNNIDSTVVTMSNVKKSAIPEMPEALAAIVAIIAVLAISYRRK